MLYDFVNTRIICFNKNIKNVLKYVNIYNHKTLKYPLKIKSFDSDEHESKYVI